MSIISLSFAVLWLAYIIIWIDPLNRTSPALQWPIILLTPDALRFLEVETLEYGYYNESCPQAEVIIRYMVEEMYDFHPGFGHALSRLAFHDCFVQGCDASILLDAHEGFESEKDSPPNQDLKEVSELIDEIKSEIEGACPMTVSCADIIVLAARESVLLAGGPFYPLHTGRRDSVDSFPQVATDELPGPQDELSKIMASFSEKGFSEREIVSILVAHRTGVIDWFYPNQLINIDLGVANSSVNTDSVKLLRSRCNMSNVTVKTSPSPSPSLSPSPPPSPSPSPSPYPGKLHCHKTLEGEEVLFVDQEPTSEEAEETWYRAYANTDFGMFKRDFASAMIKMSGLQVLTRPYGQIRVHCRMAV